MELTQSLPTRLKTNLKSRHEATLHVSIAKYRLGELVEEYRNETVRIMDTNEQIQQIPNPAYIGISPSFTLNLGKFESLKVGIIVSLPCLPEMESINSTFERASAICLEQMEKAFAAFKKP